MYRNQFGSSRYAAFLGGLGTLVDITSTDAGQVFLGGLDPRDDGQFHFVWQDDALQVNFLIRWKIFVSLPEKLGCVPHGDSDAHNRVGPPVKQEKAAHRQ